jgi:hypothetical protein
MIEVMVVKLKNLLEDFESEDGLDSHQWETLERVVAALEYKRPEVPYCAPLPKTSEYYRLADKLADILLGEKLPLHIHSMDDTLLIPANTPIHLGMLTSLAAHMIHSNGGIKIDPSPIRNKILDVYYSVRG